MAPGSTTDDYSALYIESIRYAEGTETRVVVTGQWSPGVSTPPSCEIVREGSSQGSADVSDRDWRGGADGVSIEGGSFSQEFVAASGGSASGDGFEYRARCRISQSTGRTVEATVPLQEHSQAS